MNSCELTVWLPLGYCFLRCILFLLLNFMRKKIQHTLAFNTWTKSNHNHMKTLFWSSSSYKKRTFPQAQHALQLFLDRLQPLQVYVQPFILCWGIYVKWGKSINQKTEDDGYDGQRKNIDIIIIYDLLYLLQFAKNLQYTFFLVLSQIDWTQNKIIRSDRSSLMYVCKKKQ